MTAETLFEAIGEIEEKYLEQSEKVITKARRSIGMIVKFICAAACICLVSGVGIMSLSKLTDENTHKVEIKHKGEIKTMPSLIGYNYNDVKRYYADNFDIVLEMYEYSSEYPEGTIIDQNPGEGREYIVGRTTVKVTVSKGPRMIDVPNVIGLDEDKAKEILLDNCGFDVRLCTVFSDEYESGKVISCDPPHNTRAVYGSVVTLTVSAGSRPDEE